MKIIEITADETLSTVSRDDLTSAVTEAETRLEEILAIPEADLTAEQVTEASSLDAAINKANERLVAIDAEAQATADELQAMRDRKAERAAAAEAAAAEPEVEPEVQPETDVVEPVVEVVEPVTDVETPTVETPAPEAVAASASANLRGRRPAPSPERQQNKESTVGKMTPVLVASAENGLVAGGTAVSIADFQRIARAKLQASKGSRSRQQSPVGQFQIQSEAGLRIEEKSTQDQMNEAIERAVSLDRVREAKPALVASGAGELGVDNDTAALTAAGWCSPSETVYDLCEGGSREGLFELPEIVVNRGGINFTQGLDFSALYADEFGWDITEAEMDADDFEKACVSVPCPDFAEVRLNAVGMCVTSDLLPKAAYPELEQAFLAEALIAFDHKKAKKQFNAAIATAGTALTAPNLGSVATSTLTAVALVVEGERAKFGWADTVVMEAVAPQWLREAFRADLANRTGLSELAVTDEQIAAWFAVRNIRIQYIRHYTGFVLAEGVATMPTSAQVFVFRAGTFVSGTAPVISLSTVYDSALLAQNKAMALFYEQGLLLLKRCYGARRITIPVCAVGRTGQANVTCA